MSRRIVFVLFALAGVVIVGTAAVALALTRGNDGPAPTRGSATQIRTTFGPPPSPEGAGYVVDFRTMRDVVWDDLDLRIVGLGSLTAPPGVANGALSQGKSISERVATYFQRELTQPVQRMGVELSFPPAEAQRSGQEATVVMMITDGPLPDMNTSRQRPNIVVHLVISRTGWQLDVWPSDGDNVRLARGAFDSSKYAGPLRYQIMRGDGSVFVVQPDGKTIEVTDDRIGQFPERWMAWELYQQGVDVASARIESWWAQ